MDNSTVINKRSMSCSSFLMKLCAFLILSLFAPKVFAQLDIIHYVPPFYAGTQFKEEVGNHWVVLTTPSEEDITVFIRRGDGSLYATVPNVSKTSPQKYYFHGGGGTKPGRADKLGLNNLSLGIIKYDQLNQVLADKGLIFTSENSVGKNVAFYVNMRHKSEIHGFSLTSKGQVGKGKSFRSGHLHSVRGEGWDWGGGYYDYWGRWVSYGSNVVNRRSHFISVMATEDGTEVTFSDIKVGNLTSRYKTAMPVIDDITVTLNAGESYVIGADHKFLTPEDVNKFNGTKISSDKPIVVNTGSWCASASTGPQQDIGVDQIVPEKLVGSEYILLKGQGGSGTEHPIVVATKDGTNITVNGNSSIINPSPLNAGESFKIPTGYFSSEGTMLVKTTENAYMYQTTAAASGSSAYPTVGMNFIPPLSSLGFRQVDIPYINGLGDGIVAIYSQKGADVYVNKSQLNASSAKDVSGNEEWVVYSYTTTEENVSVHSDKAIYVAMAVADIPVGAAGYFSGFTKSISPIDPNVEFSYDLGYVCSNIEGKLDIAINSTPVPDWYEWYEVKEPNDILLFEKKNLLIDVPEVETSFKLKAYFRDPNMDILYNGDFAIGRGSFASDFDFFNVLQLDDPGKAVLTANPISINNSFADFTDLDGVGKMLLAHSTGTGASDTIWQKTINNSIDIPGNLFVLKVYGRLAEAGSEQFLDIYVNEEKIYSKFQLNSTEAWKSIKAFWRAGTAESAKISIVDANATNKEAVFALDSISFVPAIEAEKIFDPEVVPTYSYTPYDQGLHLCKDAPLAYADISHGDMGWFNFEWKKQNAAGDFVTITDPSISGLDTYKLIFTNVNVAHAGIYQCTIGFRQDYEQCGVNVEPTTVNVKVIVDQPASIESLTGASDICEGEARLLDVNVLGEYGLIRWLVNGTETAQGPSFNFNESKNLGAGEYRIVCKVENGCSNLEREVTIKIFGNPNLSNLVLPTGMCHHESANLTATLDPISADATVDYSWYRGNSLIETNNSEIFAITPSITDDYYKVAVSARYNTASGVRTCAGNEKLVNLTEGDIYPQVVLTPLVAVDKCEGLSHLYNAELETSGANYVYTYSWETPAAVTGDKDKANLSLSDITAAMAGNYKVTVTNRCGSANSTSLLSVTPKMNVTDIKIDKLGPYCDGEDVNITIDATDAAYYKAENITAGQEQIINPIVSPFQLTANAANEGIWEITAVGNCGTSYTEPFTISLIKNFSNPTLNNITTCYGRDVSFEVQIASVPTGSDLTYTWTVPAGSSAVDSGTKTLDIAGVQDSELGNYSCLIENKCGYKKTVTASLSYERVTSNSIESADVCKGDTDYEISVAYEGNPTFAWRFVNTAGVETDKGTNSQLTIPTVQLSDAGIYYCEITLACGDIVNYQRALVVNDRLSVVEDSSVDLDICEGEQTELIINVTGTPNSIKWFDHTNTELINFSGLSRMSTGFINTPGTYKYRYELTGDCDNPAGDFDVVVHAKPSINLTSPINSCGGNVELSMTVNGTDYAQTSWLDTNGDLLSSGLSHTLVGAVYPTSSGTYSAIVNTEHCGSIRAGATVNIYQPVKLESNSDLTPIPCEGESLILSVTGSGDVSYKWYKGALDLGVQTTPNILDLGSANLSDKGNYKCVLVSENECDNVEVDFVIDVRKSVAVIDPTPITVCEDLLTSTFSVTATGEGPLNYQWFDNDVLMPGKTATSLVVDNVLANNGHNYHCVVNGACSSVASNKATFVVNEDVTITTNPIDLSITENGTATFTVVAKGTPEVGQTELSYQWFEFNGTIHRSLENTPVSAQSETLVLTNVSLESDGYEYYCVVSGACQPDQSASVTLSVSADNKITAQAAPAKVCVGGSFSFTLQFEATPENWVWKYNDGSGTYKLASLLNSTVDETSTSSKLTINNAHIGMEGWDFRAILTRHGFSDNISDPVKVDVFEPITFDPIDNATLCSGTGKSFSLTNVSGNDPYTYQWKRTLPDNHEFTEFDNSSLVFENEAEDGTYSVSVDNFVCTPTIQTFTISHHPNLVVGDLLHVSPLCLGDDINLTANVTSSSATGVVYKWEKGTTNLNNNSANYTKVNLADSETATYKVTVKDLCKTVIVSKEITVLENIAFTSFPDAVTEFCDGTDLLFQVEASGLDLSFKWEKLDGAGNPLANPVLPSGKILSITDIAASDSGKYRCTLSSLSGCNKVVKDFEVKVIVPSVNTLSDVTVCENASLSTTFSVVADGDLPVTAYEWRRYGSLDPQGSNSQLTISNTLANADTYFCVIYGAKCKPIASNDAVFTVNTNVEITLQPQSEEINETGTVTFSTEAKGTPLAPATELKYQWWVNTGTGFVSMENTPISATSKELILTSVPLSSNGYKYKCVITGACQIVETDVVTLKVLGDNRITLNTQDANACVGSDFIFSVEYENTTNCVWQYDDNSGSGFEPVSGSGIGTIISNSSSSILTVNSATTTMASWKFRAIVERMGYADNISDVVKVNVFEPASFTDILPVEICKTSGASFAINDLSGTGPFNYTWKKGTTTLLSGSSSNFNVNAATDSNGDYSVVASDGVCNDVTDVFSISHFDDLQLSKVSDIDTICFNNPTDLTITAIVDVDITTPLSYQWNKNNQDQSISINTLHVSATNVSESGVYEVFVSDGCIEKSLTYDIKVLKDISLTTNLPNTIDLCEGEELNLSVTGHGDDLFYAWHKTTDPTNILSTTDRLSVATTTSLHSGDYVCELTTKSECSTASLPFTVNVRPHATVSVLSDLTVCDTEPFVEFTVTGTALNAPDYNWYDSNDNLLAEAGDFSGVNTSTLKITNVLANENKSFYCVVSGDYCNEAKSNTASLFVNKSVVVTQDPVSQNAVEGESKTFSVLATGTPVDLESELRYQWFVNTGAGFTSMGNTPISATTATLELNNIVYTSDIYEYKCEVTGECGTVESHFATLTISKDNIITSNIQANKVCVDDSFSFILGFENAASPNCIWEYFDGISYKLASSHISMSVSGTSTTSVLRINPSVSGMDGWKFRATLERTGYTDNVSNIVAVQVFEKPQFNISGVTLCPNTGHSFTVNPIGTAPFNYLWTKGAIQLSDNSSLNLTDPNDGTYTLSVSNEMCPALEKDFIISHHDNLELNPLTHDTYLCIGNDISLSASLSSGIADSYSWFKNDAPIAQPNPLTVSDINDAGTYKVVAKNTCKEVSRSIFIDVYKPITLTPLSPASQDLCEGTALDLKVNGEGDNLTYTWYKIDAMGGSIISGGLFIGKNYHIATLSTSDGGFYRCVLSTSNCSGDISTDFTVNVLENVTVDPLLPIVICQDAVQSTFTATATGTGISTYQWYNNSGAMFPETNATLSVDNVLANNGQNYYCEVQGTCNLATTNTVSFTVNENISITTQPQVVEISDESTDDVTFKVVAEGVGLEYQWLENGVTMNNSPVSAQTSELVLPKVMQADGNTYQCEISSICGNISTNSVLLTINNTIKIASQPISQMVCEGDSYKFTVKYKNIVNCVWYYDDDQDGVYTLATAVGTPSVSDDGTFKTSTFTVLNSDPSMNSWTFKAVIDGSEDSNVVSVEVFEEPSFTDIVDEQICSGLGKSFSVVLLTGTGDIEYEWQRSNVKIPNEDGPSLNLDHIEASDATYKVIVSNGVCLPKEDQFTISHHPDLVLNPLAHDPYLCIGNDISLSASLSSGIADSYSWFKNDAPIAQPNPLTVSDITDAGTYKVVAKNTCKEVSRSIFIDVYKPITLTPLSPASQDLCEGTALDLKVNGEGDNLTYTWYKIDAMGGSIISGGLFIGKNYHIATLSTSDGGFYRCVLSTSNCSGDISTDFTVNVLENVTVDPLALLPVCESGLSTPLDATATKGTGVSSYQWYNNSGAMLLETNATLSVDHILANNGQNYYCEVQGTCNLATTNTVNFTVNENVTITTHPETSLTPIPENGNTSFSVVASGTGLNYKWFKDNVEITAVANPSAITNKLELTNVSLSDTNSEYHCVVTGACGFATSTKATLTVDPDNRISVNPVDAEVCEGSNFTFVVEYNNATGCVWQYREADADPFIAVPALVGTSDYTGTKSTLYINSATTNMSDWTFRALVERSDFEDNVTTEVSVKVHQPATFKTILSQEICESANVSFDKKKLSGTGTYTYVWKKGSTVLDASASILNLEAATDLPGAYSVQVSDGFCTYPVDIFNIAHYDKLRIDGFSDTDTICLNATDNNILSVTAVTDPLLSVNYLWTKTSGVLAGPVDESTYTVAALDVSESGHYSVAVNDICSTNNIGFDIHVPADVNLKTSITGPVNICEGKDLNLLVEGEGQDLLYAWYKVGASLDTLSKTSNLHIPNITDGKTGVYHCNLSTKSGCSTDDLEFMVNVLENAVISVQPADAQVCESDGSVIFSLIASAEGTTRYQWYHLDGTAVTEGGDYLGSLTNNLEVSNVLAHENETYYCIVSGDACNTIQSVNVSLTVSDNVNITSHPAYYEAAENSSASFSVEATGTPEAPKTELTYQWYVNKNDGNGFNSLDNNPVSAQTSTLVLTNVPTSYNGYKYRCMVSGACIGQTSNDAELKVATENRISFDALDTEACIGSPFTFVVEYDNTSSECIWEYKKGVDFEEIPLSVGSSDVSDVDASTKRSILKVDAASAVMSTWEFRAKITRDLYDDNFSKVVTVEIYEPVNFADIDNATLCLGSGSSFSVTSTEGTGPFYYQWKRAGVNLTEYGSTLNMDADSSTDGLYSVSVTNNVCPEIEKGFEIKHYLPLEITSISNDSPICIGDTKDLVVNITKDPLLSVEYLWSKPSVVLSGNIISDTYTIVAENANQSGSYSVEVKDACMSVSKSTLVTVLEDVSLQLLPSETELCEGETLNLKVQGTGDNLIYNWFKLDGENGLPDGSALNTTGEQNLLVANVSAGDSGFYRCILSSTDNCNSDSKDFEVKVRKHATVSDLAPVSICEDDAPAVYSVSGTAEGTIKYQWYNNDGIINGGDYTGFATNELKVSNLMANVDQSFYCEVSGDYCDPIASQEAGLAIKTKVAITNHPSSISVAENGSASFSVTASGTGPITYQWYENRGSGFVEIPGEDSNTLNLSPVVLSAHNNIYYCTVTNDCGSLNSDEALLEVVQDERITVNAHNAESCIDGTFSFVVEYENTTTDCIWEYDNGSGTYVEVGSLGTSAFTSTSSKLTITSATAAMNNWTFRARVIRDDYSDNLSDGVTVKVYKQVVFDPINDIEICKTAGASFSVDHLIGEGTITYQWTKVSPLTDHGTNSSFSLSAGSADEGEYKIEVSNGICPIVTKTFNITHYEDIVLSDLEHDNTLCPAEDLKLTAVVTNDPSLSLDYTWTKGDDAIGANAPSFEKIGVTSLDAAYYTLKVEDKCMNQSKSINIEVLDVITKSDSWTNKKLCEGDDLLLEAKVEGDNPVYTWTVPVGVANPGNVSTLNINRVVVLSAGTYTCEINGACGTPVIYKADVVVNNVPRITAGLEGLSGICIGEDLTLGAITYDATEVDNIRWTLPDGSTRDGKTLNSLVLTSVDLSKEGNYKVEVTNACGTDYSLGYQDVHPIPTLDPIADQVACQGEDVIFRAVTTGETLTYRWFVDGIAQTSYDDKSELKIENIQPVDHSTAKTYEIECRVSSCDTELTELAEVIVNPNTILNTSIRGEVDYVGSTHVFNLDITGSNLVFEWHHINTSGIDIPLTEGSKTLTINNLSVADAGEYYCIITGDCGVRFTSGYLTVKDPLKIIEGLNGLADIEKCNGEPLNLNISTEGEISSINWFKGTTDLNHHELNYSIPSVGLSDAGSYRCVIVGEGSTATEDVDVIVYKNTVLNADLVDQVLCEKEDLLWIPDVTGSKLLYTWKHEGTSISTQATLNILDIPIEKAGVYSVDVVGKCGDVSTDANLTIKELPRFVSQSEDLEKCENESEAIFTVVFEGDNLIYQWKKDGNIIDGANSSELKLQNLRISDDGEYTCVASSPCGVDEESSVMNLQITPQLKILNESLDLAICDGEDAQFIIEVKGTDVVYQWQKDGVNITDANMTGINTPQLSINKAGNLDNAYYSCEISDKCTSKRYSNSKKLTVNAYPTSQILGRMTLCVLEDRVAYSTISLKDINYDWSVNGGEFASPAEGLNTKITWGDIADGSKVSIEIINEATGCATKLDSVVTLRNLPNVTLPALRTVGICNTEFDLAGGFPVGGIYWVDGVAQNKFDPSQGNGDYQVRYSYTDDYGCSNSTGELVLTVDSLPIVNLVDDVLVGSCNSTMLSAETEENNISWAPKLYLDDHTSKTPYFNAGESTVYVASVVDKHGCVGNDIVNVTVAPLPLITTIRDTIIGECKEIEFTTHISGDTREISWTNADDLDDPTNSNPKLTKRHVGVTEYQVNVTDNYGCIGSESIRVEVLPNPVIGENMFKCEGETVVIDTKDLSNPVWSDGYVGWQRTIDKPQLDPYVLSVEEHDCVLTQKIVMNPTPKFDLDDEDDIEGITIFEGETYTFKPKDDLNPDYLYFYDWSDGSVLSELEVSESNTYTLRVEDNLGCVATDEVKVEVKPIGIESPNAFTPGGRGEFENDHFFLKDINVIEEFEMYIYNRWGELLFKTKEPGYAGGWDGTYKGKDCPVGTYVWIVILDGGKKEKGTVTLLR